MIGEPSYGALLPVCSGEDIKFRKSVSSTIAIRFSFPITDTISTIL
jgi:hypothetical protein